MLTPEYLAVFSNRLLAMYDQLEVQIVADIARRLVKNEGVTDSALWQYKQAMEIGGLQEEINSQIAEMTGKTEAEIERLFKEAGAMNVRTNVRPLEIAGLSVDLSLSGSMEQTLLAEILRTKNNIYNLTLTTGYTAADLYRQYSNQAYMQAVSGAFSPQQAIRSAVKAAADEGSYVQFPKRRDHLDVAIRRNLLTSVNQTIGVLTEMQAEDLGVQYYRQLDNDNQITIGATFELGHKIGGHPECAVVTNNVQTNVTDTTKLGGNDMQLEIPMKIGVGVVWTSHKKWKTGIDYSLQRWGSVRFPVASITDDAMSYTLEKGQFSDRHKVTVGTEYCPSEYGRKFFSRMKYRAGISYATPYLKINGKNGPREYSASVGLGIPIVNGWNNRSILNISGQWVRQDASSFITENTFRLNIGLTFNELWFQKWKFK